MANPPKTEDEMKPLQELVNEAYKTIDKAVTKGVIHANTGGRRKARVAKHKRELLIAAGLYKPAVGQPGYHKYQQMQAKSS